MTSKKSDTASLRSARSAQTSASSTSAAARARGRAEAAKIRAEYAAKEAQLKMEKAAMEAEMHQQKAKMESQLQLAAAKYEADLDVLSFKREADAAVAEAVSLEMAEVYEEPQVLDELSEEDKMERTSEFVNSLQKESPFDNKASTQVIHPSQHCVDDSQPGPSFVSPSTQKCPARDGSPKHVKSVSKIKHQTSDASTPHVKKEYKFPNREYDYQGHSSRDDYKLNVSALPYTPQGTPAANANASTAEPLANLLARRDLVSSSLYQFDDRPEHYRAWYSSYTNTTQGLGLTATEELDLMTRWLGNESSEHVKRMRSVHVNNPAAALQKAWERLRECYAAPEILENCLFKRLDDFPRVTAKDHKKLQDLGDLLMELLGAKEDGYLRGLSYLDTPRGINPIVEKLPHALQEKWMSTGSKWKEDNNGCYPPFECFTQFVSSEARKRNDPSFHLSSSGTAPAKTDTHAFKSQKARNPISVHKTDVSTARPDADNPVTSDNDPGKTCPIHNKPHPLKRCRTFRNKALSDRKAFLKEKGICFKCISSATHLAKDCKKAVKCAECDSSSHETAMHPGPAVQTSKVPSPSAENDKEEEEHQATESTISSSCTEVCGLGQVGRSCSKICLAKLYPAGFQDKAINAYVILDDQSNRSLARPDLFDIFNIKAKPSSYLLKTCSGVVETSGRKAEGIQIESLDGNLSITLPPLLECSDIVNNRSEIPTPSAALHHPHLKKVAEHIPELDPQAEILLLLGRDVIRLHKVRQQVSGPHNAPFAQRLDLGWVLVGDVCLGNAHKPTVTACKTNVLENGRPSILQPCTSFMHVKEMIRHGGESSDSLSKSSKVTEKTLGQTVFNRTESDNKPAPSIEDTVFMRIMDKEVYRDETKSWIAPLPFREPRQRLPNNRAQAVSRFTSLQRSFRRKPEMHIQYVAFMGKLLQNKHAEIAPPLGKDEECWYLPTFGVYHPQKPGQIRVVFDSSAQYSNVSLNDVLLTGPDLNNSLLGVLIRFRKERVAFTGDIQQMFHCFQVREDHRNFLRFLWYKDNDPTKEVIEYRMRVHVFGNSPSPAVAIYGLRRAIREGEPKFGVDTVQFVERHFYVDDGLMSVPTDAEAIDLLKRTQDSLAESNLRLHKFASNSRGVLQALVPEDCAEAVKDFDFSGEAVPTQRSLGLLWEITTDTFTFAVSTVDKPFTRRGVLSMVNSVFDPLGLLAPVTIQGRALLRELTADQSDWDTPISDEKLAKWAAWRDTLQDLQYLHVPRTYTQTSLSKAVYTELCVFCDASTKAIGAVAYLKAVQQDGQVDIGFVMGKSKLAPQSEPTIPRLELCAAVLAVEMAELIQDELDVKLNETKFYSDSKVVLGYIYNETKRFYVYVHNRVQRIRQSTKPSQWHYVPTEDNPADHASRSVLASHLEQTTWFTGPTFLRKPPVEEGKCQSFELVEPEKDNDIRPQVKTCATQLKENGLSTCRFQSFSTFSSLIRGVALLIHIARSFKCQTVSECKGWHKCNLPRTPDELAQAEEVVIRATQRASFPRELAALQQGKPIPKSSSLRCLSPILKGDLICVGGRLKYAHLNPEEMYPTILPKDNHVSLLLARHHHHQVKHQGRHLTEGAVRAAGLWILGGKALINSVIHKCVTCRKLRGKLQEQRMADLPPERLQTSPPFTYVGLDVFGPWSIVTRRTRGGQAENKRWAIIFTCMSSRAVHIEVIESLSTSSCINALRRFFSIRGPAKQLRSDCGTNFVGACNELGLSVDQKDTSVLRYLSQQGCSWVFNPPHSSHMGGSWERMIGMARRILESMLLQENISLTHEVLCTLMAEVAGIMNSRPLIPVSTDPDSPFILSPSMILTQKAAAAPPLGDFTEKDLYTKHWRQVQALANRFWSRWSREYLPTLQRRQKWTESRRNLQEGDVVLMKDNQAGRNNWPMAVITATFPGKDGKVRKVEVKTTDQGSTKTFSRPVTEVVLLIPKED